MKKNKVTQFIIFVVLLSFLTVFGAGSTFACGGGGGDGGGDDGVIQDTPMNLEALAGGLDFSPPKTDTKSVEPTTINIEEAEPGEEFREGVENIQRTMAEAMPFVGGAILTLIGAPAWVTIPFAYIATSIAGGTNEESRGSAVKETLGNVITGNAIGQLTIGPILDHMSNPDNAALSGQNVSNSGYRGAQLHSHSGQSTQSVMHP